MQVVIIISQIKVNCMTIVRLKSIDAHGLSGRFGEFPFQSGAHSTSNVEQVDIFCEHYCKSYNYNLDVVGDGNLFLVTIISLVILSHILLFLLGQSG